MEVLRINISQYWYFESTHNLVDTRIVKRLNLFVYPMKNLVVSTIDGRQVEGIGKCHKVSLQIQDLNLQTKCYALPLNEIDVVLRAEWLFIRYLCHKPPRIVHGNQMARTKLQVI